MTITANMTDKGAYGQIKATYRRMAEFYRPEAPGNGFGSITVPFEKLDLEDECERYVRSWWKEEDSREYSIGVPDFSDRPALIFIIEAARMLCGVDEETALRLLKMAVGELESKGTLRHGVFE